jgi:hypothetical protein
MEQPSQQVRAKGDVETRWVELVVALLVVIAGLVVIQDSLRVGIAWAAEGPKPGYFPFYIGVTTLMKWRAMAGRVFATRAQLVPVTQMLIPAIVYVVVLYFIGIYVASAIFIGAFMVWQGKYRWWIAALVAIAIVVALFFMFEVWFLVPLPKGPLESWLGY